MKVRFLGTGTSYGIPRIGCRCAVCTSPEPRNRRLRSSVLVESEAGRRVLVDATPDLRAQLLAAGVAALDLVFITHVHADHVFGLDDLRAVTDRRQEPLPIAGASEVLTEIGRLFGYAIGGGGRAAGAPSFSLETVADFERSRVAGVSFTALPVPHGKGRTRGLRLGRFAYLTDCSDVPSPVVAALGGLDVLVLDMLGLRPHPTHLNLERSLEIAARIGATRTWLTHIGHEIDHEPVDARLPEGIRLAYDGLEVEALD